MNERGNVNFQEMGMWSNICRRRHLPYTPKLLIYPSLTFLPIILYVETIEYEGVLEGGIV